MFTGIIEEIGHIKTIQNGTKSAQLTIRAHKVLQDTKRGDSIATNGVCLTVVNLTESTFTVDVMNETLRRSNLAALKPNDAVNVERALRLSDRLGGHMVSGHVDGLGTIESIKKDDIAYWVDIAIPKDLKRYIIHKGSIAIDGISLTVASLTDKGFQVSIIPQTKSETTLLSKTVNDTVNLECDMVGKYIESLLNLPTSQPAKTSKINEAFLKKYGY